jgi:hypothetical protein
MDGTGLPAPSLGLPVAEANGIGPGMAVCITALKSDILLFSVMLVPPDMLVHFKAFPAARGR